MVKRPFTALHHGNFQPREPSFSGVIKSFPSVGSPTHNFPFP